MLSNKAQFLVTIDSPHGAEVDLTTWGNYMREQVEDRLGPIGEAVTKPDVHIQMVSLEQGQYPWEQVLALPSPQQTVSQ